MLFYLSLLAVLFMLGWLFGKKQFCGQNLFLVISFALLLFFYTMRGVTVGTDTAEYVRVLRHYSTWNKEVGWGLLMRLIYAAGGSERLLFFASGLLGLGFYYAAVKRLSDNPTMSVLLYVMLGYWFHLMNVTRHTIAISICMMSVYFLTKKQYFWSVAMILLAASIHTSALIFLIFILLDVVIRKYSWRVYLLFGVGGGILYSYLEKLIAFIHKYVYESYGIEEANLSKQSWYFLLLFVLVIYIDRKNTRRRLFLNTGNHSLLYDAGDESVRLRKFLFILVISMQCVWILKTKLSILTRFVQYFEVYFTILIPNVLEGMENRRLKRQYSCVFYFVVLFYFIVFLAKGWDEVVPYVFN